MALQVLVLQSSAVEFAPTLTARCARVQVGLRPGRPSVRLEKEALQLESRSAPLPVVHNYGHGGAGLTLAWGCAKDVVQLADPEGVL